MRNNSILSNLDKDTTISEIKLQLNADFKKKNVFIIVEGSNDINILNRFFTNNVFLFQSFSGKQGVEEIVSLFDNSRVIGIRDRDYQLEKDSNKLFYYDFCCLEMMLINCDEVFESLYSEYYSGELTQNEFKLLILSKLKVISLSRKINEILFWRVNFKAVNPTGFWNEKAKDFDYIGLKKKINSNSCFFNQELIEVALSFKWTYLDYLNNTQGHDFFSLFSRLCFKRVKSDNINASARVAFRLEDFKKTNLFFELSQYSSFIGININK